jgi:hypothetical protein
MGLGCYQPAVPGCRPKVANSRRFSEDDLVDLRQKGEDTLAVVGRTHPLCEGTGATPKLVLGSRYSAPGSNQRRSNPVLWC